MRHYADSPIRSFAGSEELVEYLATHPNEPHGIYWRNLGHGPPFVMAFHTPDGAVILGVSCVEEETDVVVVAIASVRRPGAASRTIRATTAK